MFGCQDDLQAVLDAADLIALLPAGLGQPDFETRGFRVEMASLGGRFAHAHELPVEVAMLLEPGVGIRRDFELDVYRVIEAASACVAALPGVVSLHIGLAGWRDLLHVVIQGNCGAAGSLSVVAPELATVRERIAALEGTFDVSVTGAPTVFAVLPALGAQPDTPMRLNGSDFETQTVARSVAPQKLGRHLAAAAAGIGLDEQARRRVVARLTHVGSTSLLPTAAHASSRRDPGMAMLRVAIRGDHALLMAEMGGRVVAFWELLPSARAPGTLRSVPRLVTGPRG